MSCVAKDTLRPLEVTSTRKKKRETKEEEEEEEEHMWEIET